MWCKHTHSAVWVREGERETERGRLRLKWRETQTSKCVRARAHTQTQRDNKREERSGGREIRKETDRETEREEGWGRESLMHTCQRQRHERDGDRPRDTGTHSYRASGKKRDRGKKTKTHREGEVGSGGA